MSERWPRAGEPQVVAAVVAIGTNVGDRLGTVEAAVWAIDGSDGVAVTDVSGIYETAPWGGVDQPAFLNAVVTVDTTLGPHELLADLQATEAAFGRDRGRELRWGPRRLDLDLLLYGDLVLEEPDLTIPHPRLTERAFVLVPLMEVMPGARLPDGTRLSTALAALAPIDGIDLHIRLSDHPGRQAIRRPDGPASGPAWLAGQSSSGGVHGETGPTEAFESDVVDKS